MEGLRGFTILYTLQCSVRFEFQESDEILYFGRALHTLFAIRVPKEREGERERETAGAILAEPTIRDILAASSSSIERLHKAAKAVVEQHFVTFIANGMSPQTKL